MRALEAGDPSARQRLALALSGEEGTEGADVATLTEAALSEPDPNVAGAFHWAIARQGDAAIPVLVGALGSPDAERRRRAVEALEKLGSEGALAALADASPHPDPFVDGRAALARGARGDADAVPALIALIVDGRSDVEAADTLGMLASGDRTARDIVEAIVGELGVAPVAARLRLTAALAEISGDAAETALVALAEDADRRVALTAASVLRSSRRE
jgi:HEAT repeat protein